MKTITINKLKKVAVPAGQIADVVAVQLVEFSINFFGHEETFTLDTKITNDGKQFVIDGNGFIPDGFEVAA